MFRKDRGKGVDGLLVYISTTILSLRKLTLPTSYKTLEAIAVDVKIGRQDILILSIYRPPNSSKKESKTCGNYLQRVESELNSIFQWACFKKKTVIIVGDLNLDRPRLDRTEGKIPRDLHCLINEPTRVTANSQTLIDVMLTNNPDLFKNCGVYNPEISDHSMIYGEMTEKVKKHTTKTLVHRQTKTTDFDNFNKDLLDAPWHVGEIFDDLDDAYDYWRNLFDSIANEHAPMRKKRVRERDVCFMSNEWKAAIRSKRKYPSNLRKTAYQKTLNLKRNIEIVV